MTLGYTWLTGHILLFFIQKDFSQQVTQKRRHALRMVRSGWKWIYDNSVTIPDIIAR